MPLPAPAARKRLHTRSVTYQGFLREDGLWDIEGELADTKTYPFLHENGPLEPGAPVHGMKIRLTIDEHMKIHEISTAMDDTPFPECRQGNDPMQQMVGHSLGPGWRQAIEKALGGVRGCTHLRELLFNMATAAYQTVGPWLDHQRRMAGGTSADVKHAPYHLGRCIAWDANSTVVARHYPQFVGWQPVKHFKRTGT